MIEQDDYDKEYWTPEVLALYYSWVTGEVVSVVVEVPEPPKEKE